MMVQNPRDHIKDHKKNIMEDQSPHILENQRENLTDPIVKALTVTIAENLHSAASSSNTDVLQMVNNQTS